MRDRGKEEAGRRVMKAGGKGLGEDESTLVSSYDELTNVTCTFPEFSLMTS